MNVVSISWISCNFHQGCTRLFSSRLLEKGTLKLQQKASLLFVHWMKNDCADICFTCNSSSLFAKHKTWIAILYFKIHEGLIVGNKILNNQECSWDLFVYPSLQIFILTKYPSKKTLKEMYRNSLQPPSNVTKTIPYL